jgi:hypothetical protein
MAFTIVSPVQLAADFERKPGHLNKSDAIFQDRQSFAVLVSMRLQIRDPKTSRFGNAVNVGATRPAANTDSRLNATALPVPRIHRQARLG